MKAALLPVEETRRGDAQEAAMRRFFWNTTMRPKESVKDFAERCHTVYYKCNMLYNVLQMQEGGAYRRVMISNRDDKYNIRCGASVPHNVHVWKH